MPFVISVDIGSTWTKALLFAVQEGACVPVGSASVPTTSWNLREGYDEVLRMLGPISEPLPIAVSSSAKGGLSVAAIGIVPELTLEAAKRAACSAGARVSRVFPYRLTTEDVRELDRIAPDIILLTGGTDGGNEEFVLANARALSGCVVPAAIVYAGNRAMVDPVRRILRGRHVVVTDNVLPDLASPRPESAREAIRRLFLERIVAGKGLDAVASAAGSDPLPTPLTVFDLFRALRPSGEARSFGCILIDLGGATTDVYSLLPSPDSSPWASLPRRGLDEPGVKRTVEGDLGLRVNAVSCIETEPEELAVEAAAAGISVEELRRWAMETRERPERLPSTDKEKAFDALLAGRCVKFSLRRHAGRLEEAWGTDGMVKYLRGRDLAGASVIVGSGGYLSAAPEAASVVTRALEAARFDEHAKPVPLPSDCRFIADRGYRIPHFANAYRVFPREAIAGVLRHFACHGGIDGHRRSALAH